MTRSLKRAASLVLLGLAFALTTKAQAQTVYILGASQQFGSFDLSTRAYTQIASPVDSTQDRALETHAGTLYKKKNGTFTLQTITPGGAVSSVGGTSNYSSGLASDGTNLYTVSNDTGHLGRFNPITGTYTDIGSGPQSYPISSDGLQFVGGTLYALGTGFFPSGAGLYSFNTATGVPTFVGNNGGTIYNGAGGFLSSLFESGGTLYGIHDNYGGVRSLYSIETSNGNLTSVGVITGGIPSVVGATVGPAASAPEPATLSLLALGALGGVMLRRQGAGRKEA